MQKEVQEKEYDISAYTNDFYDSPDEVQKYNKYRDRIFKKEDGSLY